MSNIVTVTAAHGRSVPLHHTTARKPGGGLLIVREGDKVEVPLDAYVRRRIRVGDLVIVKEPAVAPSKES